jgi:hypothetical protein
MPAPGLLVSRGGGRSESVELGRIVYEDQLAHRRVRLPDAQLVQDATIIIARYGETSLFEQARLPPTCGQSVPHNMRWGFAAIRAFANGTTSGYSGPSLDTPAILDSFM